MQTINLSKLRSQISKLIKQVEIEGPIILEKRGRPVAVLLPIEEYRRLKRNQKIIFGEYDLGAIKGTIRRKDIYNGRSSSV
ncbi:MAG: type II toxin-antitoxin system Phd/YefM family antitoxin [Candidatus Desulfofervidus auxilii]|nr:type II toxin-antitoxin system Phd/YefM family antitoxin [Candidatus Desulfofervidus auxilii]